jgi:hypothetical protein
MRWHAGLLLIIAIGCRVALPAAPADSPVVTGELAGETLFSARKPPLQLSWTATFDRDAKGQQVFICRINAAGAQVIATGSMDFWQGNGEWTINKARIDAATWFSLLGPQLGGFFTEASAKGEFLLSGEGSFENRRPVGTIHLEWREGVLTHPVNGWTLSGISFNGNFRFDVSSGQVISEEPFSLKIGTIVHPRFGARNAFVRGRLTQKGTLELEHSEIEIAGGNMFGDPCVVELAPFKVDVNLHFQRVGLPDIVHLVPTAGLSEARGSIDGDVRVMWSAATDLQLGLGRLSLRTDEPMVVRLSPALGLLTARVPQYIDILPGWAGAFGRWLRPENPAFADLQAVELGKAELRVSALDVQIAPEGDAAGRSAVVRMVARPEQNGTAVKEVTFDVNVAGPLNKVLKLGIEQNFSIKTR